MGFTSTFKFQITFDCVTKIEKELEWKLVYVGSADNEDNDQELDSILVGPVRVGKNRFVFEAPPPDPTNIPKSDLLDVTVILLTCSYREQEFIRIGYYVHNEYEEAVDENTEIDPNKIKRNILEDKPRVTRFNIAWDGDKDKMKQNDVGCGGGDETKENENDAQYEEEDELEHEDEDEEDDDDDDDEDLVEEDLVDTELRDILKSKNKKNDAKVQEEDEEDIDMTET